MTWKEEKREKREIFSIDGRGVKGWSSRKTRGGKKKENWRTDAFREKRVLGFRNSNYYIDFEESQFRRDVFWCVWFFPRIPFFGEAIGNSLATHGDVWRAIGGSVARMTQDSAGSERGLDFDQWSSGIECGRRASWCTCAVGKVGGRGIPRDGTTRTVHSFFSPPQSTHQHWERGKVGNVHASSLLPDFARALADEART